MDFRILAFLLFIASFFLTNSMEFKEEEYNSGLFFQPISNARVTYDSFVLLYHADLQPYFEIKTHIRFLYGNLTRLCPFQPNWCKVYTLGIDRKLSIIDKNEADINLYQVKGNSGNGRVKRSPILLAAGSMFIGLINALQSVYYGREIQNLRANASILSKVNHDSLLFLKGNIITERGAYTHLLNITRVLIGEMRRNSRADLDYLGDATQILMADKLGQLIDQWFLEHEYTSELILRHLHAAIYGKYSHLIPIGQLNSDLIEIEGMLADQQRLPINIHTENPLNIFKFSTTRASVYGSKLLIEITIPKMDREQYTLFRVIPIPIHTSGFMSVIIPSMEFVLIDQSNANFIPITRDELTNVPRNADLEQIISPNDNIFHDFRDSCELTLKLNPHSDDVKQLCDFRTIPSTNYFISLQSYNKYFISIYKPTTLIEFCINNPIKSRRIDASGFLSLSENCKVRTDKITLRPRIKTFFEDHRDIAITYDISNITLEVLSSKLGNISMPSDLHSPESSILIDDHIEDFDNLANEADQLIEQISDRKIVDQIYQDKIKHNFFIIVGITTFLFIFMICIGCFLHSKFTNINTWVNLARRFGTINDPNNIAIERVY